MQKTRKRSGHPLRKLSNTNIKRIFKARGLYKDIATKYGVSTSTVSNIKNQKIWKQVTAEVSQ